MAFEDLKQIYKENDAKIVAETRHIQGLNSQKVIADTIISATTSLVEYLEGRISKTEVVNQLESISTPDALALIPHIESLNETMKGLKNTDLTEITGVMREILTEVGKIPKENIEIPENEVIDYSKQLEALKGMLETVNGTIKKIDVAPRVDVKTEKTDLEPLRGALSEILKELIANRPIKPLEAVKITNLKEIKPTDTSKIETKLDKGNKYLKEISEKNFGGGSGGGRVSPYQDSAGIPAFVELSDGSIPVSTTPYPNFYNSIETGNYTYVMNYDNDHNWQILRIDSTGAQDGSYYSGDSSVTLADAWSGRAGYTYINK